MQMSHCCSSSNSDKKKKLKKSSSAVPLFNSDDENEAEETSSYRKFDDGIGGDDSFALSSSKSAQEEEEEEQELPYHTIVIDCAPIGFADSMGITVLEQVTVLHSLMFATYIIIIILQAKINGVRHFLVLCHLSQ